MDTSYILDGTYHAKSVATANHKVITAATEVLAQKRGTVVISV